VKALVRIGMEAHIQLHTRSKMFCRCPVRFDAPANTLVCPVCLGLPGTLPVPNRGAMLLALALASALGGEIQEQVRFDRKSYVYPDLPKGYQITQFTHPLARGGSIEVVGEQGPRTIRLRRLHVEEDVGKSRHDPGGGESRIDFNRAGIPLVEVVSEPDLRSASEAVDYLRELRAVVRYLEISDAEMEWGNLRCEPNVNLVLERDGRKVATPVVEIKNLNSLRSVGRAIDLEVARQLERAAGPGAGIETLIRETRGYDEDLGATYALRAKETCDDYRYFPDPDLPPIRVGSAWREEALARVPELPAPRRRRFLEEYGLRPTEARRLCAERARGDYFEQAVSAGAAPREAANWILTDLAHLSPALPAPRLAALLRLVAEGKLTRSCAAKRVLPHLIETGADPEQAVAELDLGRIDDLGTLQQAARSAVEAQPKAARAFAEGKAKALDALMGALMRETSGRANPELARDVLTSVLRETLGERE